MSDRKNKGKPRIGKCFLMPNALSGLAAVLMFGEEKYSPAEDKGWMNYDMNEVLDSLCRHAMAMKNGELKDPESGLLHSSHMVFNAAVLEELTTYYLSEGSADGSVPEGFSSN